MWDRLRRVSIKIHTESNPIHLRALMFQYSAVHFIEDRFSCAGFCDFGCAQSHSSNLRYQASSLLEDARQPEGLVPLSRECPYTV